MGRINGHSVLIPVDEKWNPLEFTMAAEYVPSSWDGPHTGLRLIEAFKTLSQMPVGRGPRFKSGFWPSHPMEGIDIVAKEHEYLISIRLAKRRDSGRAHDIAARRKKSAAWKRPCPGRHATCTSGR
jgi:hypothetical protein